MKSIRKVQFCPQGHDTFATGRQKSGTCTVCCRDFQAQYRVNNPEGVKESFSRWYIENRAEALVKQKEYREKNKEKVAAKTKEWNEKNKERRRLSARKRHLRSKYNITPEDYDRMLETQKGLCIGCERHYSEFKLPLLIDHDHACCPTNKSCGKCIRGLLCTECNGLLGYGKDNPEILKRLIKYLEDYKKRRNL